MFVYKAVTHSHGRRGGGRRANETRASRIMTKLVSTGYFHVTNYCRLRGRQRREQCLKNILQPDDETGLRLEVVLLLPGRGTHRRRSCTGVEGRRRVRRHSLSIEQQVQGRAGAQGRSATEEPQPKEIRSILGGGRAQSFPQTQIEAKALQCSGRLRGKARRRSYQ